MLSQESITPTSSPDPIVTGILSVHYEKGKHFTLIATNGTSLSFAIKDFPDEFDGNEFLDAYEQAIMHRFVDEVRKLPTVKAKLETWERVDSMGMDIQRSGNRLIARIRGKAGMAKIQGRVVELPTRL